MGGGSQKLSGSCGAGAWRPQITPAHHSVSVSSSFRESLPLPLHSRLAKRAGAQAKTRTGETVPERS